jgi:hypothetical protein
MTTMISKCLSAAGITKIVWIDDFFASPSRDELEENIYSHIEKLKEQGQPKIVSQKFATVDLTKTKGAIENACSEILENMSDEQLAEAAQELGVLTGAKIAEVGSQPDLLPGEFKALRDAFGSGLRTFSLGVWTSEGVRELESAGEETLFLVDKEFHRESGSIDGAKLVADILAKTHAFCIILTHTCTEAEQEQRRVAIAVAENLQPHRFCVLSKQQETDLDIDPRFARAIGSVMTHKFNGAIAFAICQTIQTSANETAKELTKQSVSALEQALFENSSEEGVLEYDVVLRIFNIQQRYALNKALLDEEIQKQIRALRKFRQLMPPLSQGSTQTDMSFFRELREREVFLGNAGLNKLHAPLACGDVFETETMKRYLFLAQPCDLMVREDGKRRAEVGYLVLVKELASDQAQTSLSGSRFFDIKGVFGGDKKWQVDFQNVFVVDLSVLDFAVFNLDGCVQLQREQSEPSIALTAGWMRRLDRAKARIFPKSVEPQTPSIGMGKHAVDLAGHLEGNLLKYPLRRKGRLESNLATAILAAWATFQTRAALEYDFAQTKPVSPGCGDKIANATPEQSQQAVGPE